MVMDNRPVFDVSQIEEAITPAAVSINLFYPAANPSLLRVEKPVFIF